MGLIFTYVLTYGGSVVALVKPYYGLLIYITFAIIKPPLHWHWSVPHGSYSRIIAIAMLLGWVLHGMGNWNFGRAKWIILSLVGFWMWATLSTLVVAEDKEQAYRFVENLAKIVLPILVGLTVVDTIAKLKGLIWVILISQSFLAFEANVSLYNGYNRMALVGMAGLENNTAAISMASAVGIAAFLCMDAEKRWQQVIAGICGLLLVHAIIMSESRGGMVALVAVSAVVFFLIPKKPKHYILFALAVVAGLQLAGPNERKRFQTVFVKTEDWDSSAEERVRQWRTSQRVTLENPVFGIGPMNWRAQSARHGGVPGLAVHSTWLEIAVETGIPGVLLFVLPHALCVIYMWKNLRQRDTVTDPFLPMISRITIASLAGFAVSGTFVTAWAIEIPYYIILAGAVAVTPSLQAQFRQTHDDPIDYDDEQDDEELRDSFDHEDQVVESYQV